MPCLQEALHSMTAGPVPDAGGIAVAFRVALRRLGIGFTKKRSAVRMLRKRVSNGSNGRRFRPTATQYWKAQWGRARNALEAARAEAKDLRRVSGDALHLRSEVDRLETLLADIDVDTRKRSTMASLRIENGRLQAGSEALRKRLQEVESERDELCSQVETLSRAQFGRKSERGHKGTGRVDGAEFEDPSAARGPAARPTAARRGTGPQERGSRPAARGVALSRAATRPGWPTDRIPRI